MPESGSGDVGSIPTGAVLEEESMDVSDLDMNRIQYFPESHDRVRIVIPFKDSPSLEERLREKLVGKKNSKSLRKEVSKEIVKQLCSVV